jgi:putative membrane protein
MNKKKPFHCYLLEQQFFTMSYLYVKALHIIFIVTWFAGLFYMPRLLIYFAEAADRPESGRILLQEQLAMMQRRLWFGITWPSAVATLIFGTTMAYLYGAIPGWLWLKLGFVLLLYVYFGWLHLIFRQQQRGEIRYTSTQLRVINEIATVFLIAIVFLVVLKNALSMLWGLGGLFVFILFLLVAIRTYKQLREKKEKGNRVVR